jgi:thiazole synthase
MPDPLIIAGREFSSRLIVGTGKYKSFQETVRALEASGAEIVTVAVRRVNLDRSKESLLDYIDPKKYFLLPNTAGCYTADDAIRAARLGREVGISDWVKLEVIGDQATLYPDVQATLEATRVLVKEGFIVLPYTSDDVVFARRLLDAGAATIMPLGAPIGSGLGIQNRANLQILREVITSVPLIVDAGVGTASDATVAMELGADAVLMNTGIAGAQDPVLMASAMKYAVAPPRSTQFKITSSLQQSSSHYPRGWCRRSRCRSRQRDVRCAGSARRDYQRSAPFGPHRLRQPSWRPRQGTSWCKRRPPRRHSWLRIWNRKRSR